MLRALSSGRTSQRHGRSLPLELEQEHLGKVQDIHQYRLWYQCSFCNELFSDDD